MCHFGFPIVALALVVSRPDRKDKISRVALALPDKEAAMFPFFGQQLLCLLSGKVPMEPSLGREQNKASFLVTELFGSFFPRANSNRVVGQADDNSTQDYQRKVSIPTSHQNPQIPCASTGRGTSHSAQPSSMSLTFQMWGQHS